MWRRSECRWQYIPSSTFKAQVKVVGESRETQPALSYSRFPLGKVKGSIIWFWWLGKWWGSCVWTQISAKPPRTQLSVLILLFIPLSSYSYLLNAYSVSLRKDRVERGKVERFKKYNKNPRCLCPWQACLLLPKPLWLKTDFCLSVDQAVLPF